MNKKGSVLLITILITAGVLTAGSIIYYKVDRDPHGQLESANEQAQKSAANKLREFKEILNELNTGGDFKAKLIELDRIVQLQKEALEKAQALLAKDFCQAELKDIKEALLASQQMRVLGLENWEDLLEWSRNAAMSIAGRNPGLYSEPTWMEEVCATDCRGYFDTSIPLRWQRARQSKAEIAQRVQLAELVRLLGISDIHYDIARGKADLVAWMSLNCPAKPNKEQKAYSVTFPDQKYISIPPIKGAATPTVTANVTEMRAYTCKGIYSTWDGKVQLKQVIADRMQEELLSDREGKFEFTLVEGDSKLKGNSVTLPRILVISGYFTGPESVTGTIVEGASECN
jgi:hypothetical protein